MISANDVAAHILKKNGPVTAMKLQKLVYYSQAWHLVWEEEPLFKEKIRAWANGPVVWELYDLHRGQFKVDSWPHGNPKRLKKKHKTTVNAVLDFYGDMNPQQLSDLTHREKPWRRARRGLAANERGDREITHESMMEYYSSL